MGWYHGHAGSEDTVLSESTIKVAETIKRNNADKAVIFLVRALLTKDVLFFPLQTIDTRFF